MLGLNFKPSHGQYKIGDEILQTSIPENYYQFTGEKIIDVRKSWVFDHNPYVLRDIEPDKEWDPGMCVIQYKRDTPVAFSVADSYMGDLGIQYQPYLRHPRLYRFEDSRPNPNKVIIQKNAGSDRFNRTMSDEVYNFVKDSYSDFEVIEWDDNMPSIWDAVELIASCGTFIGPISGPMHIATCYPKIDTKCIISKDHMEGWFQNAFVPMGRHLLNMLWLDYNVKYFNESETDLGASMSYLKI